MVINSEKSKIKKSKFSEHAIIELAFGISIFTLIISLGIIITGSFQANFITGAIIGTTGTISYAVILLVFSLIATFFLSLIRTPKKTH